MAFSSESPDNLAFSNPIYADTGSSAKENNLYEMSAESGAIAIKTNPVYASTDELDKIHAELEVSLSDHLDPDN